jgi:hypothetical protein
MIRDSIIIAALNIITSTLNCSKISTLAINFNYICTLFIKSSVLAKCAEEHV